MEYLSLVPAAALGYLVSRTFAHPSSRIRKKLPNIKTKHIQIFPVFRVYIFGHVIHLHHWLYYSVILVVSSFVSMGIFDWIVAKGFILGIIVHGLRLPKGHRRIIYKDFSLESLTSPADRK